MLWVLQVRQPDPFLERASLRAKAGPDWIARLEGVPVGILQAAVPTAESVFPVQRDALKGFGLGDRRREQGLLPGAVTKDLDRFAQLADAKQHLALGRAGLLSDRAADEHDVGCRLDE